MNTPSKEEMKFIELFAGIGGFRLGLETIHDLPSSEKHEHEEKDCSSRGQGGLEPYQTTRLGNFTCVWANEIDKYACQIYRRNYGRGRENSLSTSDKSMLGGRDKRRWGYEQPTYDCPQLHEGDIHEVRAESIPDHELLVGGFPCQTFSIAGKRQGFSDTRGTLFFEICRIAKAKRPRLLLLENVKGLLNHERGETFKTILSALDELGYDAEWQVLNSKDFGVPQNRERVFIVGHLRESGGGQVFPIQNTTTSPKRSLVSNTIDSNYWKGIDNHGSRTAIASRQNTQQERNKPDSPNRIWRETYTDDMRIRHLTPTECERLQGFPDGWTEGVSDTQRYKMLGNAVTVNVIQAIGEKLRETLQR